MEKHDWHGGCLAAVTEIKPWTLITFHQCSKCKTVLYPDSKLYFTVDSPRGPGSKEDPGCTHPAL